MAYAAWPGFVNFTACHVRIASGINAEKPTILSLKVSMAAYV